MNLSRLLSLALLLSAAALTAQTTVYSYTVPAPTPTAGYAPNGNILSYTDSVTGTWNMTYDNLNRLQSAAIPGSTGKYAGLGLSMTYDSFGNRLSQTATGPFTTLPNYSATYDAGNHILTSGGVPFPAPDAAGNLPSDGHNSFLYDGENRICASRNGTSGAVTLYLYDAEGRRIAKGHNATNAWQCSMGGADFLPDATYVLGQGGEQITESDSQGGWVHSNVYAGGQLLATYDNNGTGLHFHITDPLGSRRVQVSSTGNVEQTFGNLPFGDYANNTNTPDGTGSGVDATEHHFTGKERDTESGLDYFGARYYASSMGRFSSPDPSGLVFADPTNPQSLNLYSYARNNPLIGTDPTGMAYCQWDDGSHDDSANTGVSGAVNSGSECTGAGGTWSHNDGLNDDGSQMGSELPVSFTNTASLDTSNNSISVSTSGPDYDPQDVSTAQLLDYLARDTAGFPTICSVGAYAQVGVGPVAGGYQYDSSKGGSFYNKFRATPGNPGSMPSIAPGNGGSIPMGDPSPFSASVKRTASGRYSGDVTVRDPATGIGGGVSLNEKGTPTVSASVQRGPVTVGATATLGTIGNPQCQHR